MKFLFLLKLCFIIEKCNKIYIVYLFSEVWLSDAILICLICIPDVLNMAYTRGIVGAQCFWYIGDLWKCRASSSYYYIPRKFVMMLGITEESVQGYQRETDGLVLDV